MPELPWRLRRFAQVQALVAAVIVAGVVVWPSGAAATEGCLLVFGHGRNFNADLTETNERWNELNASFSRTVADDLASNGRRAVTYVLPVDARDLQCNARKLLDRAADEGCAELIESTVYGDTETGLLVARLRWHHIVRVAGAPRRDAAWSIAPVNATSQRELPLTDRTLARVHSGELARLMTAELPLPSRP